MVTHIYIQYIFQSENKCLASSVDITGDTRFLTGTIIFCARSTTVPPRVIIIQRQPRQESMLYDPVFRATATDYGYIGRSFAAVIQGFLPRFLANRRFSAIPGVDRPPDSTFISAAIKFCYRAFLSFRSWRALVFSNIERNIRRWYSRGSRTVARYFMVKKNSVWLFW